MLVKYLQEENPKFKLSSSRNWSYPVTRDLFYSDFTFQPVNLSSSLSWSSNDQIENKDAVPAKPRQTIGRPHGHMADKTTALRGLKNELRARVDKPNLGRMAAIQTLSVLLVNSQNLAWQSRVPIQTRPKRWASRQRSPAMTDRDRSVIVPGQQTKQGRTQRCCSRK